MPMEVPSADERMTYETTAWDLSFGVRVPSRSEEWRVHYQETNLPRLLLMWARIRVFLGINAPITVECCRQRDLSPSRHGPHPPNSSLVSNLAQTRRSTSVILYSPECVGRATTANS